MFQVETNETTKNGVKYKWDFIGDQVARHTNRALLIGLHLGV